MRQFNPESDSETTAMDQCKWICIVACRLLLGNLIAPQSKAELLAILPHLSGANTVRGVSWAIPESPVVIFDNECDMSVSVRTKGDPGVIISMLALF